MSGYAISFTVIYSRLRLMVGHETFTLGTAGSIPPGGTRGGGEMGTRRSAKPSRAGSIPAHPSIDFVTDSGDKPGMDRQQQQPSSLLSQLYLS